MTSRERVRKALNHEITDRVPIDLGATGVSGIHVKAYEKLREILGLEKRVVVAGDPLLMNARVDDDVCEALGIDVVGVGGIGTSIGLKNRDFQPFTLPDGTQVMVCGGFATKTLEDGTILAYPQGDLSSNPSARMSSGGYYFDPIPRQTEDFDDKEVWDVREDYAGMYGELTDEELRFTESESRRLYEGTNLSLVGAYGYAGLGDAFHVPAPWLKETRGIREMGDWLMVMHIRPEYIIELFDMQTEVTLKNLKLYREAVGDRIDTIFLSGTDFAHQSGLLISPDTFREVFKPFYQRITDWVHANTGWKTMMHSCGSVVELLPDFIQSGFDVLNPVQVSAKDMSAKALKEKFGRDIVFWGGGCDPQHSMPNATPEEVYEETRQNAMCLSRGGGYIGGNVHNVQYDVPVENLLSEMKALRDTVPCE